MSTSIFEKLEIKAAHWEKRASTETSPTKANLYFGIADGLRMASKEVLTDMNKSTERH